MLWSFVGLYSKMYTLKPRVFYIIIRVSFPIRTTPIKKLRWPLAKNISRPNLPNDYVNFVLTRKERSSCSCHAMNTEYMPVFIVSLILCFCGRLAFLKGSVGYEINVLFLMIYLWLFVAYRKINIFLKKIIFIVQ